MQFSITLKQDAEKSYSASDLGFLLHKNPHNHHVKDIKLGVARVLYPEVSDDSCTACLHVDIDSINLVRNYQGPANRHTLKQYVNDRPYAANSFLTVAISRVLGTALGGTCNKKPELAAKALPLTVDIPVLPTRGGSQLISELFEPLGYVVKSTPLVFDTELESWGNSPYCQVTLSGTLTLSELLKHLYILIPVLDDEKHYWVDEDEIEKLIRHGGEWVSNHPAKHLIVSRYLKKQGYLKKQALDILDINESVVSELQKNDGSLLDDVEAKAQYGEAKLEKPIRLNDLRIQKVVEAIRLKDVTSIIDFGCGEGRYLREFLKQPKLKRVTGIEVSTSELLKAEKLLKTDRLPEQARDKLKLLQGSLTYFDKRTQGYDFATCIEVIEHIDEERLDAFKSSVFGFAAPRYVMLSTPNAEYNVLFETLESGEIRHTDHRFEWDRATFRKWCREICDEYGYTAVFDFIGEEHKEHGGPTQMALFEKDESAQSKP